MSHTFQYHIHKSDILIIGGACSGLTCAITAAEQSQNLNILIVDKACASKGWAGKAARTAGLLSFVSQENDPEEFVQYCVNNIGRKLNDQNILRDFAYNSGRIVKHLEKWGAVFERNKQGKISVARWPFPWVTAGIHPDICISMTNYAQKMGVTFQDYIVITNLIRNDSRVIGACGFHIRDGSYHLFLSHVTVLACGSQNFDITPNWCSTGVSQLLAFEAGAKMRNIEFCGMGDFARVGPPGGQIYYGALGGAHTAHDHLYGANGENISQKWRPGFHSSMDPYAANAWYQETRNGNGPVICNMKEFFEGEEGTLFHFHPEAYRRDIRLQKLANYPFDTETFPVIPGVISEMSAIYVDNQMCTSIPGLLAIGDASGSGSARAGAVPAPPGKIHGTGLMNAFYMGEKGGKTAVSIAKLLYGTHVDLKESDQEFVQNCFEKLEQMLHRKNGISPRAVIHRIQDAMAPCDYLFIKEESRMKKALKIIEEAKSELNYLYAENPHMLSKCIDAHAMSLCGELFYHASLLRKESRGFHFREDFPYEKEEWLCWQVFEKQGNGFRVTCEKIPEFIYDY